MSKRGITHPPDVFCQEGSDYGNPQQTWQGTRILSHLNSFGKTAIKPIVKIDLLVHEF